MHSTCRVVVVVVVVVVEITVCGANTRNLCRKLGTPPHNTPPL
jgi:hypothetical protein